MKRALVFLIIVLFLMPTVGLSSSCSLSKPEETKIIGTLPPLLPENKTPSDILEMNYLDFISWMDKNAPRRSEALYEDFYNSLSDAVYNSTCYYDIFGGVVSSTSPFTVINYSKDSYVSSKSSFTPETAGSYQIEKGDSVICYYFFGGTEEDTRLVVSKSSEEFTDIVDMLKAEEEAKELEEQLKELEQQKEKEDYIASCQEYPYREVLRAPEDFEGKRIVVRGEIQQIIVGSFYSSSYEMRVKIDDGGYEDEYYVYYTLNEDEKRLLEEDKIIIYGTLDGVETYKTVLGVTKYRPIIRAKYIVLDNDDNQ